MSNKTLTWSAPALALAALVVGSGFTPAVAEPLPYGPDTCIDGYVWREARDGDTVCVTPDVRAATKAQNADPSANKDPNGAYGPESCASGFVWREAFDGDTICVTSAVRSATKADNAAAASRRAAGQQQPTSTSSSVVFEATGTGGAYSVDWSLGDRETNVTLPWTKSVTATPKSGDLLQVVVVGKDQPGPGCRISINGKVVSQEPVGGDAHCIYTVP